MKELDVRNWLYINKYNHKKETENEDEDEDEDR